MTFVVIVIIVVLSILSPFIVAGIILFPYVRAGVARARIFFELRHAAKQRGYVFKPLRRCGFLSLNTSRGFDVLLIGKQKIFAVKLWSAINVQNSALVRPDRTLLERSVVPEPLTPDGKQRRAVRIKKRAFPDLTRNFPPSRRREIELLILYAPKYSSTYVQVGEKNLPLRLGEKLFGATVCDKNTVYRFL